MTELLTMMATPAWAYLALFGFLAVDAMVPVVPIQAIMITSGALTVYGNLNLPLVIAVGALGMFTGDSIAFVLGRTAGQHVGGALAQRPADGPAPPLRAQAATTTRPKPESKTKRAAERFTRGLRRPGPLVLLLCRFVPGGRMAAGYHAGRTGYPIKLFVALRRRRRARPGPRTAGWSGTSAAPRSPSRRGGCSPSPPPPRSSSAPPAGSSPCSAAASRPTAERAADGEPPTDDAADDRSAPNRHCSSCSISWRAASAIDPDSDG